MRRRKELVGSQLALTTRPPPRAGTLQQRHETMPSSCEPPIIFSLGNKQAMPERKHLSIDRRRQSLGRGTIVPRSRELAAGEICLVKRPGPIPTTNCLRTGWLWYPALSSDY